MSGEVVSTWFGAFLLEGGRVRRELRFPPGSPELIERLRRRREGRLAPEEERLVGEADRDDLVSRDRRFEALGVVRSGPSASEPSLEPPPGVSLRELLLAEAEIDLHAAWDPSIHIDEAVRSMADLDRSANLIGERLASWEGRDRPHLEDDGAAGPRPVPDRTETPAAGAPDGALRPLPPGDPALLNLRDELRRTHQRILEVRRSLDGAVEGAVERRTPNLAAVLGPLLAGRIIAAAGGLDRLARLPASTVQVLGAERAFFDHLRRGSRPPRHGLLFLHPMIQGASRKERGRLARALAGKAAIAARLDRAERPLDPSIAAAFERRAEAIRAAPRPPRNARSVRTPLHRATEDR